MSQRDEFEAVLLAVFKIRAEDIRDEATPEQIKGWDSVTHMDLVARLEEKFKINFDVDEITEMETVGMIRKALAKHGVNA